MKKQRHIRADFPVPSLFATEMVISLNFLHMIFQVASHLLWMHRGPILKCIFYLWSFEISEKFRELRNKLNVYVLNHVLDRSCFGTRLEFYKILEWSLMEIK